MAAFVCLPGVKDSLDGLLPDDLSTVEDYLQDSVTVEADVENLTAPQVMLACATNADALGTNAFDLSSLNELTDGRQPAERCHEPADGWCRPTGGRCFPAGPTVPLALLDGASQLNSGASALDDGLGQLTNGLDTLSSNNAALQAGAQQVADGVLASANSTLMEGGLIDTP